MWDIWRLCGLGYLHDRWKGVSLFLTLLKKSCSNNKASCLYINPPENLLHPPKPKIVLKVICMWQYENDKMTLKYFKYSKTVSLITLELWAYLFERALRWAVKMQHREEVWEEFQVSSSLSVQHATLPPNSASAQRDWPRCCAKRPLSPPHPSLSLSAFRPKTNGPAGNPEVLQAEGRRRSWPEMLDCSGWPQTAARCTATVC